jgi:hypothetical protein
MDTLFGVIKNPGRNRPGFFIVPLGEWEKSPSPLGEDFSIGLNPPPPVNDPARFYRSGERKN